MNVCIIDTGQHEKHYQLMYPAVCGFNHIYPGKLFTLDEAQQLCTSNGYTILKIGTLYQCADYTL